MCEFAGNRIVLVQPAAPGADPKTAIRIFEKGRDIVVADGIWIMRVMPVMGKSIAIVSVQPILRADPDITLVVLQNGGNVILRQPILDG